MTKSGKDIKAPPLFGTASRPQPPLAVSPFGTDIRMQMAMRQTGFDARSADAPPPRPFTAPVAKPRSPTVPSSNPPSPNPDSLTLRRQYWLQDVMDRQRALSPVASGLVSARGLTGEQFLHGFYAPGRPVLIQGAMDDWPALSRWSPDYLARLIGGATVEYQGGRRGHGDFELAKDRHRKTIAFDRYITMITADGADNDAYITAYNSAANKAAFAPLERDMGWIDAYLTRAHGMVWIGPAGTFTPLHFDLTNNMLAQITGSKRVILVPPSQTPHLAHSRHVFSDVHDLTDPARLAAYPAARDVLRYEVELKAGDLLYIPIGWWHQVRADSFSVMATYTNFLWPNEGHASYPPG